MNLKVFCLPFRWHLISVHLPRRCHSAAFYQNANLKTTLFQGKLHNIAKFLIIHLQDADKQIISAVTSRVPDIIYFLWSCIATYPLAAPISNPGQRLPHRWMHTKVFCSRIKGCRRTTDPWVTWRQVTWPGKRPRMLRFMNSRGEGRESATNRPGVCTLRFKNSSFFWDGYSHELATHEKGGTCLLLE